MAPEGAIAAHRSNSLCLFGHLRLPTLIPWQDTRYRHGNQWVSGAVYVPEMAEQGNNATAEAKLTTALERAKVAFVESQAQLELCMLGNLANTHLLTGLCFRSCDRVGCGVQAFASKIRQQRTRDSAFALQRCSM